MKTLLKDPAKFYRPKERPSGHDIAESFSRQNGGAIPSNLLQIPNTDSNSHYLRACKLLGEDSHPARFPEALPRFFIRFLTSPGDIVVDIFSGSNTTGHVAECLGRSWLSIELDRAYARLSAVRFMEGQSERAIRDLYAELQRSGVPSLRLPLHRPKITIPVEVGMKPNSAQPTLFT
jgi:site-specific DNA-methyltransferase (cytosine-N4-specific)